MVYLVTYLGIGFALGEGLCFYYRKRGRKPPKGEYIMVTFLWPVAFFFLALRIIL